MSGACNVIVGCCPCSYKKKQDLLTTTPTNLFCNTPTLSVCHCLSIDRSIDYFSPLFSAVPGPRMLRRGGCRPYQGAARQPGVGGVRD